jgi:hypothetical protein
MIFNPKKKKEMKKLYTIIVLTGFALLLKGQSSEPVTAISTSHPFDKTFSINDAPMHFFHGTLNRGSIGPFSDYFDRRSGTLLVYAFEYEGKSYPVTGTNGMYYYLGTKYSNTLPRNILGLLVGVGQVSIQGFADTFSISIWQSNATNRLPESIIGTFSKPTTADLRADGYWTYLPFNTPIAVNTHFVAVVRVIPTQHGGQDGFTIYSNRDHDGMDENNAVVMTYNSQQQLVAAHLSDLFSNIDVDPMIIPIINTSHIPSTPIPTGIEKKGLNGLDILGIYPNPAQNYTRITFYLQNSGETKH